MFSILVVDDEKNIRMGIIGSHDWGSEGIEQVFEAENGIRALEIMDQYHPQIVITDVRMPKMDGLELSRILADKYAGTKNIIISGYDDFKYAQEAIKFGAMEYLLKPARIENIVATVRKAKESIEAENARMAREEMLAKKVRESLPLLRDKYLNAIVKGTKEYYPNIKERFDFLGIKLIPENFVVLVFDIDDFDDISLKSSIKDVELVKFAVSNIINELMEGRYTGIVFENSLNQITVILNFNTEIVDYERKTGILDFSERCMECIIKYLNITVTVGIGCGYKHITQVCLSYEEALAAVRYKLFIGKNRVIHINDIRPTGHVAYSYPKQFEEDLMTSIRMGDEKRTLENIRLFFEAISGNKNLTAQYIRRTCAGILFIMFRKLMEDGIQTGEQLANDNTSGVHGLEKMETLGEMEYYVCGICTQASRLVAEVRHLRNRGVVIEAKKYVRDNLCGDLSLNLIAEVVHMSPNYFTYLFKQETGENFSEYVAKLRVDRAKELLMDREIKAYEVGQQVGYQDSRYFSQFFKKYTGMTPSEFRGKGLNKNEANSHD